MLPSAPPSLKVVRLSLPGRIEAAAVNALDASMLLDGKSTLVVGDLHAGLGNLLIYGLLLGRINIPQNTARTLDCIAQSSCIDQMEEAWHDYNEHYDEWEKYDADPDSDKALQDALELLTQEAKERYEVLHEYVCQEVEYFNQALSEITLNQQSEKTLFSLGDDVADRNYCDGYTLFISVLLDMNKILSNHGLELLRAWVLDDWDYDYVKSQKNPFFSAQHRSLNTLKILCKHGIISVEKREHILKQWGKTLHIMMCSKSESLGKIELSFLVHAPNRFKTIFNLAKFYKIDYPNIDNMRASDFYHLVGNIMQCFKTSLEKFCSDDAEVAANGREELQLFVTEAYDTESGVHNLFFTRSETYMNQDCAEDEVILQRLQDNERKFGIELSMKWIYGHDAPINWMPIDMVGMDTAYWKPLGPKLLYPSLSLDEKNYILLDNGAFREKTILPVDDENKKIKPNVVYLSEYPPPIDGMAFKLWSTRGETVGANKKGNFVRWKEKKQESSYKHVGQYLSGVITADANTTYKEIKNKIINESKSIVSSLGLYQEANPNKTYFVGAITTSQEFPLYQNGQYTFPPLVSQPYPPSLSIVRESSERGFLFFNTAPKILPEESIIENSVLPVTIQPSGNSTKPVNTTETSATETEKSNFKRFCC